MDVCRERRSSLILFFQFLNGLRPEIDAAVRAALVPRLDATINGEGTAAMISGFSSYGDLHGATMQSNETPISVSTLRPSALDKIQDFLLKGERRQAYHYALDEKLWAHAMVIASGIDKEAWKDVVNEFLKTELAGGPSSAGDGREALRVAYSLLSGQGAAAGMSECFFLSARCLSSSRSSSGTYTPKAPFRG